MQLLEIGLGQFIEYGYFGTSTRKIAGLAGVSSGLMFHYFPTKEALYLELIRMGCEVLRYRAPEETDPLEYFRREADRVYGVMEADAFSANMFVFMEMAMFSAAKVSEKAAEMIRDNDLLARAVEQLKKGQAQGVIRQGNPWALATAFYGALQSVAEWRAGYPSAPVPEKEWLLDLIRA